MLVECQCDMPSKMRVNRALSWAQGVDIAPSKDSRAAASGPSAPKCFLLSSSVVE